MIPCKSQHVLVFLVAGQVWGALGTGHRRLMTEIGNLRTLNDFEGWKEVKGLESTQTHGEDKADLECLCPSVSIPWLFGFDFF